MTDLERYDYLFCSILKVDSSKLPGLKYRGLATWDSLGHMDLISSIEEAFRINISTIDVLDFSSYEKGKEILSRYGVDLQQDEN